MSGTWITPIFDRTSSDVSQLKSLHEKILSIGFNNITLEEKLYWLYGEITTDSLYASDGQLYTIDSQEILVISDSGSDGSPKGSLNYIDLNRIENNIEYLYNILVEYGNIVSISTMDIIWNQSDFPILSEIDRIKSNIIGLLNKISYNSIIQLNDLYIDYSDLNTLEFEINQLNFLLLNMISNFRYSGEFYSGTNFNF